MGEVADRVIRFKVPEMWGVNEESERLKSTCHWLSYNLLVTVTHRLQKGKYLRMITEASSRSRSQSSFDNPRSGLLRSVFRKNTLSPQDAARPFEAFVFACSESADARRFKQ